jgi:dTDP-4-amino-4,6-dideoxygalactose transaminase
VYLTRPRVPDASVFHGLVDGIFRSRWLTNDGALVKQLEARLREKLGLGCCAVFCNGTVALEVALRALDLSGEVITTPFTFPATVHAIQWNGLTPVFADIDPETYNLDVDCAADLVTNRTSAVLPVHVFGNPCEVVGIQQMAQQNGLRVVYDAAHAFGVSHRGKPIGSWGDLSILSFHATKLFHTCEGGAIVGADDTWLRKIGLLRNFGIVNEEEVRGVGLNGKLSELHAAMGVALLDHVDEEIRARGKLTAHYRERLSKIEGLSFQRLAPDTVGNHAYFSVEIDAPRFRLSRNVVHIALRAENVISRKYFFPLCSENESYRWLPSARPERLPHAHRLASRILCLPLHGELTHEDIDKIADCISAIQSNATRIREATGAMSA